MNDWNQKIIEEFRANEGRVGGMFEGAPMIIGHHVGAKSDTKREAPLVYFPEDDGRLVIAASKSGAPTNPDWYHNVKANPTFDVEVGTERFSVNAEEIIGADRETVWKRVVSDAPGFGEYQEKTTRQIPLLRLTRVA